MAKNFISTRKMSHEEWLAKRQSSIGGSDIGVILGISPYKTPFTLWMEKTGRQEPEDLSQNKFVQFGVKLEPIIADWFQEQFPEYKVVNDNKIRFHPEYTFLSANLDRIIIDEWGDKGVLEIKTTTPQGFKKWQDDGVLCDVFKINRTYYAQIQHYLAITGFNYGMFAILVDKDLKVTTVRRDEEWINQSIQKAVEWYENYIVMDQEPPLLPSDYNMVIPNQGTVTEVDEEIYSIYEELVALKGKAKDIKMAIEDCENRIKEQMGEVESITYDGQVLATWKTQKTNRFDQKRFKAENPVSFMDYTTTTTSRVFRLKTSKGDDNNE